jgi:hypothetical protein
MNSSPKEPCPMCSATYPHECGISVVPHYTCSICGAAAYFADDDCFRHANQPFEDQSTFCDRYGYPIPVTETQVSCKAGEP